MGSTGRSRCISGSASAGSEPIAARRCRSPGLVQTRFGGGRFEQQVPDGPFYLVPQLIGGRVRLVPVLVAPGPGDPQGRMPVLVHENLSQFCDVLLSHPKKEKPQNRG